MLPFPFAMHSGHSFPEIFSGNPRFKDKLSSLLRWNKHFRHLNLPNPVELNLTYDLWSWRCTENCFWWIISGIPKFHSFFFSQRLMVSWKFSMTKYPVSPKVLISIFKRGNSTILYFFHTCEVISQLSGYFEEKGRKFKVWFVYSKFDFNRFNLIAITNYYQ